MKKLMIVMMISVLLLTGCATNVAAEGASGQTDESQQVTQSDQDKSAEAEAARLEEERLKKEAEEAAAAEEKRLAEEAKRLEEEKAAKLLEIAEKTYYSKDLTYVYSDEAMTVESGMVLDHQTSVWVKGSILNEAGEVVAYQIEAIDGEAVEGFVNAARLFKTRQEQIKMSYDGVDYSAFEKTTYEKNPPVEVKAVYLTQATARNDNGRLDDLIKLANETEINAFVIDVKNDDGYLLFHSESAEKYLPQMNDKIAIKEIAPFIQKLKENDIYLIARIVTFKSPQYARTYPDRALHYLNSGALYSDRDKISWSTAYDRDLWEYVIGICEEAADVGFDEIQFDYVRFPATGAKLDKNLDFQNDLDESKTEAIHKFLSYAYERLSKKEVYITADVFGWAATSINDVGIGQHWESVTNVVDYIAPMMYPSHYGPNNFGLAVPDAQPYATIDASIKDAIMRNANLETPAKLRPWIQDFTARWVKGYIPYRADEVKAQIQALEDNGVYEYMLWNPGNVYSEDALRAEQED
ncbi:MULTISPECIES: putative glycoside hydrolase [unclassified Fusibacter]|uniref:putative glycoside hydrolase n=1 Tax=unclassified Fusibacter TaxID=2624464 RepID=UPI001010CA39|nr:MULTISPECIES: putative glycoside hydrolase [unclassified Fusibacter]MCK8059467.1 putative glycoside hydrolase [Fusibacter sp. A2]NPE21069.1 putative glycoside hydrolase [Fusibacter sp. A1]RXV62343.1 hypothetical protein DWB64_04485 [Fusibacter sp. A1]